MSSTVKGGKGTRSTRGQVIDTSGYGPAASGATEQAFWDSPPFENTSAYGNAKPLGIEGDEFGQSPWDRVVLNGYGLPGLWEATATPAIQLDVQKPNGFDGAALISRGYIPAGITLTGRIWTPAQWSTFQRILPTFWAPPNHYALADAKRATTQVVGQQRAVKVDHPGLAAYNIHYLVIQQITPPEPTGDKGVRQIRIIAKEYVPEPRQKRPATKKTKGVQAVDRSVQAEAIYGKQTANAPPKPSKAQSRYTGPLKVTL